MRGPRLPSLGRVGKRTSDSPWKWPQFSWLPVTRRASLVLSRQTLGAPSHGGNTGSHPVCATTLSPVFLRLRCAAHRRAWWCREGKRRWLARKDSNLQSPDPESGALPIRPLASAAQGAGKVYRATTPSSTVRLERAVATQGPARPACAVRPCRAVPAPAVLPRYP